MRFLVALLLFTLACADETVVSTTFGTVRGTIDATPNARSFRGIPYAAPPIGERRFAPPVSPDRWSGVLDATKPIRACPQSCDPENEEPLFCPPLEIQSEDCLVLSVFTPRVSAVVPPLPVLVWFHGGNFRAGWSGGPLYDGRLWAASENVIIVPVNYRLNSIGFLMTPDLKGNYGLRDQQLALRWVQANIGYFGGDPTRVTIFGQSAGAGSVAAHVTSPASSGLFSRAIMQSEMFAIPYKTIDMTYRISQDVFNYTGCGWNDLKCLRAKPIRDVMVATQKANSDFLASLPMPLSLFMPWTPTIGTEELADTPLRMLVNGMHAQVPIMLGTTSHEAIQFIFAAITAPADELKVQTLIALVCGLQNLERVVKQYPPIPGNDQRPRLSVLATDLIFTCTARNASRAISQESLPPPLYLYQFTHPLSFYREAFGPNMTYCWGKVCHASEIGLQWRNFWLGNVTPTNDELVLAQSLMGYWSSFARHGDPNVDSRERLVWPRYTVEKAETMRFDTPANSIVTSILNDAPCGFWDQLGYYLP